MTSTRERMLRGAVDLIRERGVAGVTVDAIVTRSEAPRGSVYYHFPDGRAQIVREALDLAGDTINAEVFHAAGRETSAREALLDFVQFWKTMLEGSDFKAGCPFVAAAVDGIAEDPALRVVVTKNFTLWQDSLASLLAAEGQPRPEAMKRARLVVAAVSGAVVLCRAERSTAPLEDIAGSLSEAFLA